MISKFTTNFKVINNSLSKGFFFETSSYFKPKDGSKGEDSFSIGKRILCVADGVGGWKEHGVDPGQYSKTLVKNYMSLYNNKPNSSNISDIGLFSKACHLSKLITGSSTFCSCRLQNNVLYTLNLGDSGYALIQKGKITYRSREQQHSFNFPFQVGTNGDSPLKAEIKEHDNIEEKDLVILATDGLWDNIYEATLLDMILNGKTANEIGELCYKLSKNRQYISPFSINSQLRFLGGKQDDITILIGMIKRDINKKI